MDSTRSGSKPEAGSCEKIMNYWLPHRTGEFTRLTSD